MNKHFIFTSGRSGSNYLSNTLNLSESCVNYGEVLGEWTIPHKTIYKSFFDNKGAADYLDFIYSSNAFFYAGQVYSCFSHLKSGRKMNFKLKKNVKSIGVKDFCVTMEKNPGAFQYIAKDREIKVIYLYRANLLKRYISMISMVKHNRAVSYKEIRNEKIRINIAALFEDLEVFKSERVREENFISNLTEHDVLSLEYEEYFKDGHSVEAWNRAVFDFLGLRPISEFSKQKKILSNALQDIVVNYDELVSSLRGTEYEIYLA